MFADVEPTFMKQRDNNVNITLHAHVSINLYSQPNFNVLMPCDHWAIV